MMSPGTQPPDIENLRNPVQRGSDMGEFPQNLDPWPSDVQRGPGKIDEQPPVGADEEAPTPDQLMAYARAAVQLATQGDLSKRRAAMTKSWNSYNNQHSPGSRYKHENYSARSKLFVPKTRASVQKNLTAFATALFATNDVVSITAQREADPRQQASADVLKADLNLRLDRTSHKSGIPWFWISMAGCIDAQVSGVVISKQYWEYEYVLDTVQVDQQPANVVDMAGAPVQSAQKKRVLRDRPQIDLQPPENVIVDMAAPFWSVIQDGSFLVVKIPMHVGDIKTMMKEGRQHMGGGAWYAIPDDVLGRAASDYSNTQVRTARDKGSDRYSAQNNAKVNDLHIVWVHENFVRFGGRDYQFWSLGTEKLLSKPIETVDAYPAHHGERPYVMGVGAIEPHNALPMSLVESIQPLQDEANDTRNLALDSIKQSISPIAKVKRGQKVDLRQLRKRGPDATIMVNDKDDVTFDIAPVNAAVAFEQMDRINVEMDELAGSFSTSSVQSNRNLNETVGGMKLMSGSAGGKTEFDLRVMVETWVEPAIRHVVWLIQFYESDDRLLAIAGDKAKLFQKYGIDKVDDDLLSEEVTVRVNVGIGSADPMQRLQKFFGSLSTLGEIAQFMPGQVIPKGKEIFDEAMGLTGYPEAERFFEFKSPEQAMQNAPPSDAEINMKKVQADTQNQQAQTDLKRQELELKKQEMDQSARQFVLGRHDQQQQQGRDFGLKAAGHNQQLIDGATGTAGPVVKPPPQAAQPQQPAAPPPQEQAMADQLGKFMASLGQSQATQTEAINHILQLAQQQMQAMTALVQQMHSQAGDKRQQVRTGMKMPAQRTGA